MSVSGRVNHAKFGEASCWKGWTRPLVRPFYSPRMALPKWWIRNVVASLHHCTIFGWGPWEWLLVRTIDLLKVTMHLAKTEQRLNSNSFGVKITCSPKQLGGQPSSTHYEIGINAFQTTGCQHQWGYVPTSRQHPKSTKHNHPVSLSRELPIGF